MNTILSSFTVYYAFNDYIVEQFVAKNMWNKEIKNPIDSVCFYYI